MFKFAIISTLFTLAYFCIASSLAQSPQKNDHLFSGRIGLEYREVPRNRQLELGISLDWQYLISNKWSLGLGIRLHKNSRHHQNISAGENSFTEVLTFSPSIYASRFYPITEKWTFALAQEVNYLNNSQQTLLGYSFQPVIYYGIRRHWLLSARTSLASITYNKSAYNLSEAYLSISIQPSIKNMMPSFSLSYLL